MDQVVKIEIEPTLPLKLAKAVLATAAGLIASELTKKAFDKIVESRQNQDPEVI